jgi:hypothetical protein
MALMLSGLRDLYICLGLTLTLPDFDPLHCRGADVMQYYTNPRIKYSIHVTE